MEIIIPVEQQELEPYVAFFDTLSPLHLRCLPKKQQKKIEVLTIIARVFSEKLIYTEKEVNALLLPICDDFVEIRRNLIDYHILTRTKSGSQYQKNVLE